MISIKKYIKTKYHWLEWKQIHSGVSIIKLKDIITV